MGKGLSDEELIAASRYGMIRASHKFDKSRGFTFAAYAVWWMRETILQEICHYSCKGVAGKSSIIK